MNKDFIFYRCYPERVQTGVGEPGLLAATEVVQAVCNAGFQRNGFKMKSDLSSPHCYYKFAKTPKDGMFMLRAVKKSDMTTLDILIDTRLYPSFVMIEKNTDWQKDTNEVKKTLEKVISNCAEQFNWRVNLREHHTNATQYLKEFISALTYMNDSEDVSEVHHSHVQTMDLNLVLELKPLFYNNVENTMLFLKEIERMQPNDITDLVNRWVADKRISDYGNCRKGELWGKLNHAGLYTKSRQNWNRRVL